MNLSDYHFDLPEELIGQEAIEPRDSCKLLVLNRGTGALTHHIFRDLADLLGKNTVLVLNDTKVFPSRLYGTKDSGGKIEVLLLKQVGLGNYRCIARGKIKIGQDLNFGSNLTAKVLAKDEEGQIDLEFNYSGPELLGKIDELGKTPLPPYIHSSSTEADLRQKYQTVYAKEKGSAAAPTAGLHFTPELLVKLQDKGVQVEKVTLHVGLGTFKPVTEDQVAQKTLHSESFWLTEEVASRLNQAKGEGKKIIAVGTTTCRVLETQSNSEGQIKAGEGETNIFIQQGTKFNFVDGLITNFHLPGTSLLMLVTALVSFPNATPLFSNFQTSLVGEAYAEAINNKYKFFSFGDAMLII